MLLLIDRSILRAIYNFRFLTRFAEAVSRREKVAVKAYIVEMAMYKVPLQQRGMQSALFERSLCIVGQERSTSLFRESFISTTRHLISSNTKIVSFYSHYEHSTMHKLSSA